jgi:hypothetical protein
MSTPDDRREGVDLTAHPLAPTNPSSVSRTASPVRVIGFIGPSEVEGHVRVYTDLSFAGYYDVAEADVISAARVDPNDGNSPTAVLIDSSATVDYVQTSRTKGTAAYVKGAIQRRYSTGRGRARIAPIWNNTNACTYDGCRTQGPECYPPATSYNAGCPPPVTYSGCPPADTDSCTYSGCLTQGPECDPPPPPVTQWNCYTDGCQPTTIFGCPTNECLSSACLTLSSENC